MHSLPEDSRGRDLLGHRKKPTKRGTLTLWRRQGKGAVRTRKGFGRARHTHFLETAEGGICQDTERIWPARCTHKLKTAVEETCQDMERNLLSKHTHVLVAAKGGTCQDTERNRLIERRSHAGDSNWRDLSGRRKKPTERGILTNCRRQREELVRTRKEIDRARRTNFL